MIGLGGCWTEGQKRGRFASGEQLSSIPGLLAKSTGREQGAVDMTTFRRVFRILYRAPTGHLRLRRSHSTQRLLSIRSDRGRHPQLVEMAARRSRAGKRSRDQTDRNCRMIVLRVGQTAAIAVAAQSTVPSIAWYTTNSISGTAPIEPSPTLRIYTCLTDVTDQSRFRRISRCH